MNTALQEEIDVNEPHYIDDGEEAAAAPPGAPEPKEEVVVADAADDIQVEIEDDTPIDDQNRKPLSQEARDDLEIEEDAEHYSENVKKRISKMRKAMHDERREKEASQRREVAATEAATAAYQRANNLEGQLTQGQAWALEQATQRGLLAANMAQQKLKGAIEEGDVDAQAEAQAELGQAQQFQNQVAQLARNVPQQQQQQQPVAQPQQQAYAEQQQPQAPVDTRAEAWKKKNSEWFEVDEEMTQIALVASDKAIRDGLPTNSDEYYERIEKRLQAVYPKKFGKQQPPSTVVAPAGRVPQGKRVVLTRSEVAIADSMGITKEQYAREKLKMGYV